MKRILLIEDEDVILKALTRLLERNHYSVTPATTVETAIDLNSSSFDLVLADLRLPGEPGTSIIPAADPVPVIIMTSHASVRSAVDAMRSGAIDYIAKPFDHDELLMVIGRSLMQKQMHAQNRALKLDIDRVLSINHYLNHPITNTILQFIADCKSGSHLHLHGESGTHRERIARAIHGCSERADAPFVVLEASTLMHENEADTLAEYLQLARNGTLLIRYCEKLSAPLQRQLAESLQGEPKTSSNSMRVNDLDIMLVTISSLPIVTLQADKLMTTELVELLKIEQHVESLRQRRQDIVPLAQQLISQAAKRNGIAVPILDDSAAAMLEAHDWPGNIAELEKLINHTVTHIAGNVIAATDFGFAATSDSIDPLSLDAYFRYAVLRHQGRLTETELAAMLGISRKALWERRQKMHLLRDPGPS